MDPFAFDPRWRALTDADQISVLSSNPRSLFHDIDEGDIRRCLQNAGAEISAEIPAAKKLREQLPKSSTRGKSRLFPEGYFLFEEEKPLDYVYVTLKGSIVFFHRLKDDLQPGLSSGLARQESIPAAPPGSWPLATLNYLYYNCGFAGVLWQSQIAGLLELGLMFVNNPTYPEIRKTLIASGIVSTNSITIRIPVGNRESGFTKLFYDNECLVKMNTGRTVKLNNLLLLRCFEIVSQRFATSLRHRKLRLDGGNDRILAYILYEYALATGKDKIVGTRHKAAFYSRCDIDKVNGMLESLEEYTKNGHNPAKRGKILSVAKYSLNCDACLAYYQEGFSTKGGGGAKR